MQASLKVRLFQLWISLSDITGHPWPLPRQRSDEYHSKDSWLCGHISKSKVENSWPLTLWSQNHSGWRHFATLLSDILLSQEELATLHKFIDKNLCYRVNPSLFLSPWSTGPHYQKKDGFFDFALTFEASTEFPRETIPFCSFLTPDHHEKHESTPILISGMHTILYGFHLETNGRLHSKPAMVH